MARLLIESGADVNVQDGYKNTPLHDAAAMGNVEVVRMLLDHGANIDVIDENGKTPLDYADDEPEIKAIFDEYRHKRRELPETPSDSPTQGGSP
jgi:ankyrin repeat protein